MTLRSGMRQEKKELNDEKNRMDLMETMALRPSLSQQESYPTVFNRFPFFYTSCRAKRSHQ